MNLLARRKMSSHLIFSSPSPANRFFNPHPTTALQQSDFYSTKTTTTRSNNKTQQLTKPTKTQKPPPPSSSSSSSSSSFTQRIKKQTEALTNSVWPMPAGIPYQAKVANFVNLIGFVELPVRFESGSDGKHFATTVISLVSGGGGERRCLNVPVVFEGDLAHVVSCHVKANDCVFVSGQLSLDGVSDGLGKFRVVAENVNFVEGFKRGVEFEKDDGNVVKVFDRMPERVDGKNVDFVERNVEFEKPSKNVVKVFEKMPERVAEKNVNFVEKNVEFEKPSKNVVKVFEKMPERVDYGENDDDAPTLERRSYESKLEKGDERNAESVVKKKDAGQMMDLWRDLIKNPLQWWDYRNHKANGSVKEKHPDFKQKVTGESLWISSAPKWVLPGIGKLEFDVIDIKPKQVKESKGDDSWKNLVENPDKWWDNRTKKTNPKAPDFRHKETGESLWLNRSPAWVSAKLPPMYN